MAAAGGLENEGDYGLSPAFLAPVLKWRNYRYENGQGNCLTNIEGS